MFDESNEVSNQVTVTTNAPLDTEQVQSSPPVLQSWQISVTEQFDWSDHPGSITLTGTKGFAAVADLAEFICTRHWVPFIFSNNVRHGDNFVQTEVLTFDFDDGFTLAEVEQVVRKQRLLGAICLSKSHQIEKNGKGPCDRFRLILPLATAITDKEHYRALWYAVAEKLFMRDPSKKGRGRYWVDDAAKDVARFYYRCSTVHAVIADGTPLSPTNVMADVAEPIKSSKIRQDGTRDDEYLQKNHLFNRVNGYLNKVPGAVEGDNGNSHTYKVAVKLVRDFGLSVGLARQVLMDKWNGKCSPPWDDDELLGIVQHAEQYGANEKGSAHFEDKASPYKEWNTNQVAEECCAILDKEFVLLRERSGEYRIFRRNQQQNEVVLVINEEVLKKVLHDGLTEKFEKMPSGNLVSQGLNSWKMNATEIKDDPIPFTFAGDDRLTFKQLNFTPTEGPFPSWDEFLDRIGVARKVFMAFVWSIYEEQNKGRQYIYMHGDGEDGKSTVIRVIAEPFGNAKASIDGKHLSNGDKFLYSQYYGKRLLVYPDCKNPKFGMSEFVRNVTSGDACTIEFKGKTPFSANLFLKLMVGSNAAPEITGQNADLARLIYIEVTPSKNKDDPTWEDRLKAELPYFLHACKSEYKELCPHHGKIPLPQELAETVNQLAHEFEEDMINFVHRFFVKRSDHQLPGNLVKQLLNNHGYRDSMKVSAIKRIMSRELGALIKKKNSGIVYLGIGFANDGYVETLKDAGWL